MEEEYPITEAETSNGRSGSKTIYIIGGIIVLALIIAGISLPPISIWERFSGDSAAETSETQEVAATSEAPEEVITSGALSIPGEIALTLTNGTATVTSVPATDFAGASTLPANIALRSNVYALEGSGSGRAALAIPPGTDTKYIDLYSFDGATWHYMPSEVNIANQEVLSADGPLPQALALAETAAADTPVVAAAVLPTEALPTDIVTLLSEISAGTLTLVGDGDVQGQATAVTGSSATQFVRVTNTGAIVDGASLNALLSNDNAQSAHIANLLEQSADFAGINLDYQGVNPAQSAAFTNFVIALADALHTQGKQLAITLATPQNSGSGWNTGGQDWAAIGQAADIVYLQMPLDPTAYADNGPADQLLLWATKHIDRNKINLLVSAHAVDKIGEAYLPLSNEQALAQLGELQFVEGATEILPGDALAVVFSGNATPLEWDGSSLTYKFTYDMSGQIHTVWLGSEAALAHRLRLAKNHHLRGVTVQGLATVSDGTEYANALSSFIGTADAPAPAGAAIVWTVRDAEDSVVASASGDALSFDWDGTETAGIFNVNADFALGETTSSLGTLAVTVVSDEVTEEVALGEAEVPEEETTTEEETSETETSVTFDPGAANGVVNLNANVRNGPGLGYGIAGGLTPNTPVIIIGRSSDSNWLQIIAPDDLKAWIFATLVTVNAGVDIASLPVPAVPPPVVVENGGGSSSAPLPVVPPASIGGGFEFGGQTHTFANPTLMSYAGMNWVKFQHKWGDGDTADAVAGRIQQAHANGFKVLLSIPGADHSSINYQSYINFLAGVAALGPDAIEVWNEQNIDREWPSGQIDPAAYVNNMLKPAYNAIKAANPNVMVISGAPAPTGFFGGCGGGGCNDDQYMAGMAAAGAANYMDCIGIHYNEGVISPSQTSGDPRGASSHYSRYFWGMVNTYWNAFGGSRKLCFTELGYLSGDDYGGVPGGFSWAGNTSIGEHATWLAEAVSLASNSGKVRLVIVFNVDFTHYSEDPQAGFAMVRKDGSCPACETLHQATGGR
jgi:spore germination protein YaaH